jgi:biotin transporter BioY
MSGAVHEMPLRRAAIWAFVAMCLQDLIATAMVIFESRYAVLASGLCDVFGYLAGLVCSVLAIDSILRDGWRNKRSLVLIGAVTIANFVGTTIGVLVVAHLTHH